jgi:hypothetical protein
MPSPASSAEPTFVRLREVFQLFPYNGDVVPTN